MFNFLKSRKNNDVEDAEVETEAIEETKDDSEDEDTTEAEKVEADREVKEVPYALIHGTGNKIDDIKISYNPVLANLLGKDGDKKATVLQKLINLANKSTNQLLGMHVACLAPDDLYSQFTFWSKTEIDRIISALETKGFVNSWDIKLGTNNVKCFAINQDAISNQLNSEKAQALFKKFEE